MKIFNLSIAIFVIFINTLLAQTDHGQHVHQYICREAYEMLKLTSPDIYNNIDMKNWIGDGSSQAPWNFGDQQRVVAGAWDEDVRDVIWKTECFGDPTHTHFWKSVDPNLPNQYTPYEVGDCGGHCDGIFNAWNRIEHYINGGWELLKTYSGGSNISFQRWDNQGTYTLVHPIGIVFVYEGLVEGDRNLYHHKYMKIKQYLNWNQQWIYFNPPLEIRLENNHEKYFSYEILGRMCHCLQDMSVPAHIHIDGHPHLEFPPCNARDSYERKMYGKLQDYNKSNTDRYINPLFQTCISPGILFSLYKPTSSREVSKQ